MTRFLQWLNLIGVVTLAVLCCVQWSINQRLLDDIAGLHQANQQQSSTIADLNRQLADDSADLVSVRQRLDISESSRHTEEAKISSLDADLERLGLESARYKEALDAWIAASNARDAIIQQANTTIKVLSVRCAVVAAKYNDLVGKYNQLVSATQGAQTKPK